MPEQFPETTLARLILQHIDAPPQGLRFQQVPTGHFNTTYFVDGAHRPLVLRIAPPDDAGFIFYERGMMAQEPQVHALIRERTSAPVGEIIAHDTSRERVDRDYIIMERLPGIPLTEFPCSIDQFDRILHQTGSYLREIHDITSDSYGYLGAHNCMEPQDTWANAFHVMWHKLIDDVAATGYYDHDDEALARELLDQRIHLFDRPVTSRLLHMDIWSQNILVDAQANVTGLVDFDRAVWGDKEIEFAVLDYCGISEPAFWSGYGQQRDTSPEARIRQAIYLLYEVQKYIVIRHHRHSDSAGCRRYKSQSLVMMQQLARLA